VSFAAFTITYRRLTVKHPVNIPLHIRLRIQSTIITLPSRRKPPLSPLVPPCHPLSPLVLGPQSLAAGVTELRAVAASAAGRGEAAPAAAAPAGPEAAS
jgi:hypothetical protein